MRFSFHQFYVDYFAQKVRIFLTILAIGFASAAITVMLAVGDGLRVAFNHQITQGGVSLLVIKPGNTSIAKQGSVANRGVSLSLRDFAAIKSAFSTMGQFEPELRVNAIIQSDNQNGSYTLNGINATYGQLRHLVAQTGGRFINERDVAEKRPVIFLGEEVAKRLFPKIKNPIGRTVTLSDTQVQIVGVLQERLSFLQITGAPDQFQAWMPLSTLQILFNTQQLGDIVIQPHHPEDSVKLAQSIRHLVATQLGVSHQDDQIIDIVDTSDLQNKTQVFSSGLEIFLGVIGTLTLAMSGVGLANVMTMAVQEAIKEIGTRKAIGARTSDIVIYYLLEALITTLLGGAIGLLFAYAALLGIEHVLSGIQKIKWILGDFKPTISYVVLTVDLFVLLIVGIFCGCVPARAAAQIPPSEALRHEAR